MKGDIDMTVVYPHPVDRVWAALTSSEALAAWLMPNDFEPVAGRRFTFRTEPAPGFDGIVRCEVLEIDPPRRMVWSWAGGNIDTTVTFTLEPVGREPNGEGEAGGGPEASAGNTAGGQTRLRMRQVGFHGLGAQLTRRILAGGYPRILGQALPAYLDRVTGSAAGPARVECAEGWRSYLGIFRRWAPTPPAGRASQTTAGPRARTPRPPQ